MKQPTLTLAAALLLSTASFVHAQRGDGGPPQAPSMDRGPSVEIPDGAGKSEGGPAGLMRKSEGPNPAVRDDAPAGEPRRAVREDAPGPADTAAGEKRKAKGAEPAAERDTPKASRKSAPDERAQDDVSKPKSTVQEKSAGPSNDRVREKAAQSEPAKGDNAGAGDRANRASKGASPAADQADGAQPGDASKEARGERKPLDEVKKADLSGDREERARSAFRGGRDVKHRRDVDVNIVIGATLPSAWDYAPVPVTVIEVVPEYRGYVYTYVDDTYVITDPATYEVVAVLPAGGATYAGGGGSGAGVCSTSLMLDDDERAEIVKSVQIVDEVDVSDVTVGWSVPRDIELKRFPEGVLDRSGKLASCRYFVADDQIAIVDPEEDTVVLLIDHD